MSTGGRAAGPAALGSGGLAAADVVAVPAQDRVRCDQQPQSLAPRFRYHAEQGREQCLVRPGQVRAARLPSLQDGKLVAQIKISAACHASSRWDSRSHVVTRVMRRNANCRHMIGDHHGRGAGRATLLVRAVDAIFGTHRAARSSRSPGPPAGAAPPPRPAAHRSARPAPPPPPAAPHPAPSAPHTTAAPAAAPPNPTMITNRAPAPTRRRSAGTVTGYVWTV